MSRVLVFSGGGDYGDPWHPFAETSARVAEILGAAGHDVTVVDTLAALETGLRHADVLVVNAGGGPEPHPLDAELAPWRRRFRRHAASSRAISALSPVSPASSTRASKEREDLRDLPPGKRFLPLPVWPRLPLDSAR